MGLDFDLAPDKLTTLPSDGLHIWSRDLAGLTALARTPASVPAQRVVFYTN